MTITEHSTAPTSLYATQVTSMNFSHTVPTGGTDVALVVGVACFTNVTATATYNGVAMTSEIVQGTGPKVAIFSLANPATGANTVAISFSATAEFCGANAFSFAGVDQTTPVEASGGAAGAVATLTTLTDGALVVDTARGLVETSITVTGGQTLKNIVTGDAYDTGMSTEAEPTAGLATVSWASGEQVAAVALKPSVLSSVSQTSQVVWNVDHLLTATQTSQVVWDLAAQVSQTSQAVWNVEVTAPSSSVGSRFVQRQSAARTAVSNTVAADFGYNTTAFSETEYEGWGLTDTDAVKVLSAGKYLLIHGTGEVNNIASSRQVGTLVPVVNNVDQGPVALATHRYTRVSGGANEGVSIGFGVLDLAANDTVGSRIPGVWGGKVDAVGTFDQVATAGGALQLVKLDDTGQWLHLERSTDQALTQPTDQNTVRPWLDTTGLWTKFTWPTEIADASGLHAASSGDVVLSANKKYLITYSAVMWSSDPSRHTDICRLNINGTNVQYQSGYQRSGGSQGPPMSGMYLHETGGTAETLYIEGTQETEGADAGIPQFSHGALQVIELPSSAEWVHADNGAVDSQTADLAGTTIWYKTPLSSAVRSHAAGSLVVDSVNSEIQNASGGPLSVLAIGWLNWDRNAGTSGSRKVPASGISHGSFVNSYGWGGAFSRGQQSLDDTWHASYTCAALVDVNDTLGLGLVTRDQANANNATMGVFASTNRHFLGLQVLDLSTLAASGGTTPVTQTSQAVWDLTTQVAQTSQAVWDLTTQVAQTSQAKWDVTVPVAQTSQAAWDVTTQVTQTTQAAWNVTTQVAQTTQAVWDVVGPVSQTTQAVWDVTTQVTQTTQAVWDLDTAVAQATQAVWDVTTQVAQTSQAKWDVTTLVDQVVQAAWDINQAVAQSSQVKWDVTTPVSQATQAVWDATTTTPLSGAAATASGSRANLANHLGSLAAYTASASSASASLSLSIPLSGSAQAASGASAVVSTDVPLSGKAPSSAGTSASLARNAGLSALSPATASATASLVKSISLFGSAPGAAGAAAGMPVGVSLSGSASAAAGATATFNGSSGLTGSAGASAGASGALSVAVALSGASPTATGASATFSGTTGLAGRANAAAGLTGALARSVPLSGSAATSGGAVANASINVGIAGSAPTASSARGILALGKALYGAAPTSSAVSTQLSGAYSLSGSAGSSSGARAGALGGGALFSGKLGAASGARGLMGVSVQLAGTTATASGTSGTLPVGRGLAGNIASSSDSHGNASLSVGLSGASAASSSSSGAIAIYLPLQGNAPSGSAASGVITIEALVVSADITVAILTGAKVDTGQTSGAVLAVGQIVDTGLATGQNASVLLRPGQAPDTTMTVALK